MLVSLYVDLEWSILAFNAWKIEDQPITEHMIEHLFLFEIWPQ